MKKGITVIGLIIIMSLLFYVGEFARGSAEEATVADLSQTQTADEIPVEYTPQEKAVGAVNLEVVPLKLLPGSPAVFAVTLNTHSVELNDDFTKRASLNDDRGNTYIMTTWTGGSGGHHLAGELSFEDLKGEAKTFTLTLSGIDSETAEFEFKIGGENNEP